MGFQSFAKSVVCVLSEYMVFFFFIHSMYEIAVFSGRKGKNEYYARNFVFLRQARLSKDTILTVFWKAHVDKHKLPLKEVRTQGMIKDTMKESLQQ